MKILNVLVTGATGFVGGYLVDDLNKKGYKVHGIDSKSDLRNRSVCKKVVRNMDGVIHLAAKFGGIGDIRNKPADYFDDNVIMGLQLAKEAMDAGVKKYVCVGTVCSYPKNTDTPFREEYLWDGALDDDVAPYGMSKKVLLFQLQMYYKQYGFKFAFPILTNLYGAGDKSSHVIPDLIRKFKNAKINNSPFVTLWGDGYQTRDFLHVRDASRALVLAFEKYNKPEPINVGSGKEISIREVADIIKKLIGYDGVVKWDTSMPSGHIKRVIDNSNARSKLKWQPSVSFRDGIMECL